MAPKINKASEKRAVDRALTRIRCPYCRRSGAISRRTQSCWKCGAQVEIEATYVDQPTKAGFRKVAEVTVQVSMGGGPDG